MYQTEARHHINIESCRNGVSPGFQSIGTQDKAGKPPSGHNEVHIDLVRIGFFYDWGIYTAFAIMLQTVVESPESRI